MTLKQLTDSYLPILLQQMDGVKLMNRIDTKFVTTADMLVPLLDMARNDYYIQDVDGERNMIYETTYYDTEACDMYCRHQHGHVNRQKIRFRTYVLSGQQFLEVKTKNNHGRTKKKRIAVADMNLAGNEKREFLAHYLCYDADSLVPHMHNFFNRMTLVNKSMTERLTIDTSLKFHNLRTDSDFETGPLVIVELKRDSHVFSPALEILRRLHIHPHGFSKYCMGAAMTNGALPVNRFKEKLRDVEKILNTHIWI